MASHKLVDKAPEADQFVRDLFLGNVDIDNLLRPMGANGLGAYAAACKWVQENAAVWRDWIPIKKATLSFAQEEVRVQLPATVASVPLVRERTPIGDVQVTVSDVTHDNLVRDGELAVSGLDYQPFAPTVRLFPSQDVNYPAAELVILATGSLSSCLLTQLLARAHR